MDNLKLFIGAVFVYMLLPLAYLRVFWDIAYDNAEDDMLGAIKRKHGVIRDEHDETTR